MTAAPSANKTYIIGHRNPDADAICSAIAYAALKEAQGEAGYEAARCGNSNARIDTILNRFQQPLPVYLSDVTPRVRDVMSEEVITLSPEATCAEALEMVDVHDVRILPVLTPERYVKGTVSVFNLGGYFVPRVSEPREMRRVFTSLDHITRSLKGRCLTAANSATTEELFVRIGAMDVRSFWKVSRDEASRPTSPSSSSAIAGTSSNAPSRSAFVPSSSPATCRSTTRWWPRPRNTTWPSSSAPTTRPPPRGPFARLRPLHP